MCSVLQCVAACVHTSAHLTNLPRHAHLFATLYFHNIPTSVVCCSVLQRVYIHLHIWQTCCAMHTSDTHRAHTHTYRAAFEEARRPRPYAQHPLRVLHCVAVFCKCVAVCCSVLQYTHTPAARSFKRHRRLIMRALCSQRAQPCFSAGVRSRRVTFLRIAPMSRCSAAACPCDKSREWAQSLLFSSGTLWYTANPAHSWGIASHCNTLRHTSGTLQRTMEHCNCTATHCGTLQLYCNALWYTAPVLQRTVVHCTCTKVSQESAQSLFFSSGALQRTVVHCKYTRFKKIELTLEK